MTNRPYVLWLIWQNEKTRQRYHVGTLIHEENKYIFKFETNKEHRGLQEAVENGYIPHLAFPDVNKVYVSPELFGPFAKRVPDEHRPDFQDLLKSYGLSKDYTPMDLLRVTGGKLGTDSYEFVPPIYLYENEKFEFDFYIAGWRHWNNDQEIREITKSTELDLKREPKNPEDPHAVAVTKLSGKKLGFIPAFYSKFMDQALQNGCEYRLSILSVNPEARPQRYLHVYVKGNLKRSIPLYQQINLEPLQKV